MQICLKPFNGQEKLIYSSRKQTSDGLRPGVRVERLNIKKNEETVLEMNILHFDCSIGHTGYIPNEYVCQMHHSVRLKPERFIVYKICLNKLN